MDNMEFLLLEVLEGIIKYEAIPQSGTVRFTIEDVDIPNRIKLQRDVKKAVQSIVNTSIGDDELLVYEKGKSIIIEIYDFIVKGKEEKVAKQIENFIKSNSEKDIFMRMFTDDVQYTITNITLKEKVNLEEDIIGVLEKDFKIDRKMLSIDYRDNNMIVGINKNTILGKENKILGVLENLFQ